MSLLNDVINAALREHNVPQVGSTGTTQIIDALRSLLAPTSTSTGKPPDATHVESDALQQLVARFEESGYANIVRSWIGAGANQPIEPHRFGDALGQSKVDELTRKTGVPRQTLLDELARLLPTVIDRLTPDGRLPQASASARA